MNAGENGLPISYSVLISTVNKDDSPVLSAVMPVLVYGLRVTLDLPRHSKTATNLARTGECVINLPSAESIGAIDCLARTVMSIDTVFEFNFSNAVMDGRLAAAHMTPIPSEAVSALRALECPMQLEARIQSKIDAAARELIAFELNILRVHLDPSVVLSDVQPNMWKPIMACLRQAYRTSSAT